MKTRLIAGLMLVTMLTLLLGACVTPVSSPTTTPATPATTSPATPPITTSTTTPTSTATVQPPLGTVEVYVTDAPPDREVTAVLLTISRLEIHRAVAEQEQEQTGSDNQTQEQEQDQEGQGEWIVIDIADNMTTFDLLKVEGIKEFFGEAEVAAGKYTQLRLIVYKAEVAFLGDDEPQEANVPSQELKIVRPFDVKDGETTTILLDFDAERSVIVTGSGRIQVKPVVKLSIEMKGASGEPKDKDKDKDEEEELDEEAEAGENEEVTVEVSSDEFQDENHISREVEVAVGDLLVVTLGSNPSTGFQWSENATIDDATVLEQLSHEFIAPQGGASSPPGTPGTEVWTFKVLKEGTTTLFMEYGRPWQGGEKGTWTFELAVTVD